MYTHTHKATGTCDILANRMVFSRVRQRNRQDLCALHFYKCNAITVLLGIKLFQRNLIPFAIRLLK